MTINYRKYHWQINNRLLYSIFLLLWLAINLIQAYFTQLHYDEAYYWVYSRHLAFGYFDHPPMVAFLIKLGYSIFHNELGVRLFFVLLGTATTGMILFLINEKKDIFFLFLFILSVPILHFHVGGFLALPDTPLVFFATLFFIVYRRFLKNETVTNAIILGIVSAAMLYCKYHGILIIILTVISNLKLLYKWKIWIAFFTILLMMLPHLWWQYVNDFPTVNYQFFGRFEAIRYMQPFSFILGQLLIPGLLTGFLMLYFLIKYKAENDFEKSLKWNIYGFYIFFIIFSFRTNTQPHWTAAIIPIFIFISYKAIKLSNSNIINWYKPLAIAGIIVLIFPRILVANDALANKVNVSTGFNYWKYINHSIASIAKGREVMFISSYRRPSEYAFYSGKLPVNAPEVISRFSQYDLIHNEDSLDHKDVILVDTRDYHDPIMIGEDLLTLHYKVIPGFISYHHLGLIYSNENLEAKRGAFINFSLTIKNISNHEIIFSRNPDLMPKITSEISGIIRIEKFKAFSAFTARNSIFPKDTIVINYNIKMPTIKGDYRLRYYITYGNHLRSVTGKAIKLKID
jgi:hypothetical protein